MRRRARVTAGLLVVSLAILAAMILLRRSGERAHGALRHEVYIWQRAWTQPVRGAVTAHAANFARLVPLWAEISWQNHQPQLVRVALDYATLTKLNQPLGLALRIGPYAGPFATNDAVTSYLGSVAITLVSEAQSNGVELAELQIDFDCPESKLDGYRLWLEALQRRIAPVPLTMTALPSWLDSWAFTELAGVATNYVLQVHSVARPRTMEARVTLCEPRAARQAVERAGRIGVPFRVALPTYGYVLAFDPAGKFIGLSAEGPRPTWPTNARLRKVTADPLQISALVQDWTASRPGAMSGLIWYRLPTTQDRYNWDWARLQMVMQGTNPQRPR